MMTKEMIHMRTTFFVITKLKFGRMDISKLLSLLSVNQMYVSSYLDILNLSY